MKRIPIAASADAARIAGIAKRKGRTVEEQTRVEEDLKKFLLDIVGDDPDARVVVGGEVIKEKKVKPIRTCALAAALMIATPAMACTDPPANAACARYSALTAYRRIYSASSPGAPSEIDARAAVEASDYGRRMEKIYYDDFVAKNGGGK
jgi:hypothetical protein